MRPEEELLELLKGLPQRSFDHELDFTREIVPGFVRLLGYAETETFYEYPAGRWRADVVLSRSVESSPWAVIEIKRQKPKSVGEYIYQLKRNLQALHCELGVVIS